MKRPDVKIPVVKTMAHDEKTSIGITATRTQGILK